MPFFVIGFPSTCLAKLGIKKWSNQTPKLTKERHMYIIEFIAPSQNGLLHLPHIPSEGEGTSEFNLSHMTALPGCSIEPGYFLSQYSGWFF